MMKSLMYLAVAAVLTTLVVGCAGTYDVIPVKGTVTYDGEPVPNVRVTFQPSEGRPSSGSTQADGTFELVYSMDQNGVEPGDHQVKLAWAAPSADATEPSELVKKVLDDFKKNGPIQVTIDKPESNFEIKLPR